MDATERQTLFNISSDIRKILKVLDEIEKHLRPEIIIKEEKRQPFLSALKNLTLY